MSVIVLLSILSLRDMHSSDLLTWNVFLLGQGFLLEQGFLLCGHKEINILYQIDMYIYAQSTVPPEPS